ncbi:hypothetical protein AAVH_07318, partial [Aphelenchoides avenae]
MYWNTWDQTVGEPGGSYATHPAHAIFHPISIAIALVDITAQVYTLFLMVHVAKKQLSEYRYFMMLCTARFDAVLMVEPTNLDVGPVLRRH